MHNVDQHIYTNNGTIVAVLIEALEKKNDPSLVTPDGTQHLVSILLHAKMLLDI